MCVCVAIGDSLSHCSQEFYHVFSQLNTEESTHLEAAISILDTMEGVLAIAIFRHYHVCGWSVQSVYTGHRGCSQERGVAT